MTIEFESLLDLGIDCSPSNPECEYSEESIAPDGWSNPFSPTRIICLAHHDQIEAALAQAREAELAKAAPKPSGPWGNAWENVAHYESERPF